MAQGSPSVTGEAFGSDFAFSEDGEVTGVDFSDEALDQEASEQAPQPQTQEPVPAPEPAPPAEQAQAEQETPDQTPAPDQGTQPEAGEQQPEGEQPAPRKWAGRYLTPEQLEDGYRNIQRLQSRTQQTLQQREEAFRQAEQERAQLRAALEQVTPYLEHARQVEAQLQGLPVDQRPVVEGFDPTTLTAEEISRLVQQQVGQETQKVREQTRAELQTQELQRTVESFISSHPDAQPGSELDFEIGAVLEEFQTDPQGNRRYDLFPVTSENLEVAYSLAKDPGLRNTMVDLDLVPTAENLQIAKEAAQNPALAEVLVANPTAVDSDKGLEWARKMASLPGMYQQAAQQVQQPSPEAARRAAHVETGGTGAPVNQAPGPQPLDEFDEALSVYNKGRSDNVFGLAVD